MNRWVVLVLASVTLFYSWPASAAERVTLALLVASNSGTAIGRPDLHYADDDAARYYEVFRTVGGEGDIAIVTRFDRDSERLYPSLREKVRAPTKASVRASAAELARRASELRARGVEVDFYFVFAGHGDVERGRGFLQLEDGTFTADDLEGLLKSVPATRSHVVLDSCNSFFVVNARKPGGEHVSFADDAARDLSRRLPNVGVFVSTSAEGEVFEWSELGAGIFSHAVRSGISGGADADGNGTITYAELEAFVNVAAAEVKNPRYRPHVFARGPEGRRDGAIFSPARARGRRVSLDEDRAVRVTIRDADDIPWIDIHKEKGAAMTLVLPAPLERAGAIADESVVEGSGLDVPRRRRLDLDGDDRPEVVALGSLPVTTSNGNARGPSELFRMLFVKPFGPHAFAAQERERSESNLVVFGISDRDVERFDALLEQVSEDQRSRRMVAVAVSVSAGVFFAGAGTLIVSVAENDERRAIGVGYLVSGVSSGLAATLHSLRRGRGEKLAEEFRRDLRAPGADRGAVFLLTERKLQQLASDERKIRHLQFGLSVTGAVLCTTGFVLNEVLTSTPDKQSRYASVSGFLLFSMLAALTLTPSSAERLAASWSNESKGFPTVTARLSVAPTANGAIVGLGGTF